MSGSSPAQHLPGVLHTLEPALNRFGYLAVAGVVFLEDFGVPVPGETILILGAVYAGAGRLNIVLVALLGLCGAVLGDNVGFAIGRAGGRQLIARFGRYVFLTERRLDRATSFFERRGGRVIILARFVEGLRQANGLIAGTIGMPWRRFLLFNAIGGSLWVTVWSALGYLAGSHIDAVYYDATHSAAYLGLGVGVMVLAYVAYRVIRHRRSASPELARVARPGPVSSAPEPRPANRETAGHADV